MKRFFIYVVLSFSCLVASASDLAEFVRRSNDFSIFLFNNSVSSNSVKDTANFCVCPPLTQSQGWAFCLAGGGESLEKAFFLKPSSGDFYRRFTELLKTRQNGVSLESAVFSRRFLPLKKTFSELLKDVSLSSESFNPALPDVAALKISQWFGWLSFGLQKDIFKPENISVNADFMLCSSAVFNFDFFAPNGFADLKFTFKNGKIVDKTAAVFTENVAVGEFKDFDAAILNVKNTDYSMVFMKPRLERAKTMLSKLDAETFENAFNVLKMLSKNSDFRLIAPKFKLNSGLMNLNSAIESVGAGAIFKKTEYPKFSDEKLNVGNVFQAAWLSMRPAAAGAGLGKSDFAKTLVLDGPFAVAVCESKTGRIIFLGAVENPKMN
ncbi:MAG: hypothetical protein J6R08_00175 [Opitutales bacterium]|nr:hypothetical protein [Opitutales bacterium]